MIIKRNNFYLLLPHLLKLVKWCDYISIECKSSSSPRAFTNTVELQQHINLYHPIGIALTFSKIAYTKKDSLHIPIFSYVYPLEGDIVFAKRTYESLKNTAFDFDDYYYNGVHYSPLLHEDKEKPPREPPPESDGLKAIVEMEINMIKKLLDEFVASPDDTIVIGNYIQSKLIFNKVKERLKKMYKQIKIEFSITQLTFTKIKKNNAVLLKLPAPNCIPPSKKDIAFIEQINQLTVPYHFINNENTKFLGKINEYNYAAITPAHDAVGFSRIFSEIFTKSKPLIINNSYTDLLIMFKSLIKSTDNTEIDIVNTMKKTTSGIYDIHCMDRKASRIEERYKAPIPDQMLTECNRISKCFERNGRRHQYFNAFNPQYEANDINVNYKWKLNRNIKS